MARAQARAARGPRTVHRLAESSSCCGRRETGRRASTGGRELTVEAVATAPFARELLERGLRREFWIVGPEYADSEKEYRVLWNDVKRLGIPLDRPGSYATRRPGHGPVRLRRSLHRPRQEREATRRPWWAKVSPASPRRRRPLKKLVWTKYIRDARRLSCGGPSGHNPGGEKLAVRTVALGEELPGEELGFLALLGRG